MPVKVNCYFCKKRVFDVTRMTIGGIEIKCPHCNKIISYDFNKKRIIALTK